MVVQKKRGEPRPSDVLEQVDSMFPEPLFESAPIQEERLCLVCGNNPAHSVLRTPSKPEAIVPLCKDCSIDWNFYGYGIFKKIKLISLMRKVAVYFLLHPLRHKGVWNDVKQFNRWQKKMRRIRKQMLK